jgi:phosphoinositide-3-kinase, regulatory subunit 4
MENPRQYGPITALCLDRKRTWIVVGTSTGVLTLWDRRFGLLLKSWHVGIASTGRSVRIHQCVIHPAKGQGKWIMVAVEASRLSSEHASTNLIEVWDIENGIRVETFVTRTATSASDPIEEPYALTGVEADTNPAAAIASLVRSRQANMGSVHNLLKHGRPSSQSTYKDELLPAPAPDVRAIVVGSDLGGHSSSHRPDASSLSGDGMSSRSMGRGFFMLTGSENCMIRFWDLGDLRRTVILSGLEAEHEGPSYR